MKVNLKFGIKTYSGTIDDITFGSYRHNELCIGREFVYPTITANNHKLGSSMQNLALVFGRADSLYRDNFKTYATTNGTQHVPKNKLIPSGYALFIKMMYAWQKSDPTHVDLATVTIADIVALDAEVRTVARAVDAGFLAPVTGYATLTGDIQ